MLEERKKTNKLTFFFFFYQQITQIDKTLYNIVLQTKKKRKSLIFAYGKTIKIKRWKNGKFNCKILMTQKKIVAFKAFSLLCATILLLFM